MAFSNSASRFVGADILRNGAFEDTAICVADGKFADQLPGLGCSDADLSGYCLLPGIIDLHGDAFERHIAPRPTAPFPTATALVSVDRDAAANGVTTAWMAQSWSWEGGSRGPDFAETFMADLATYRPHLLTDLRIQLRCETHTVETADRLIDAVKTHGIDYVIFNNHIDEALEMVTSDPEGLAIWGKRAGRDLTAHVQLVKDTKNKQADVPRYLCTLASAFDELGVKYGSHDDSDATTRDYYSMIGAKNCEFPTKFEPAQLAKNTGDPILMGAPNVVRGGSQSGNISAEHLIRHGLCDALVSDYHYPSLAQATRTLADKKILSFEAAWAMVSINPARIMGLSDRGEIADGKRADMVVINTDSGQIEGTMVAGRWSFLCGALAQRICTPNLSVAHAAE